MVVAVHGDTVVWLDRDRAPMPIDVYDLGTRAWSHFTIDTKAFPGSDDGIDLEAPAVSGDRLYFVPVGLDAPLYRSTLWSVPLDGSEPPTEVTRVGSWGIDGATLVWTDTRNAPVSRVTVRNLETGKEHSFDPQSGDRCNQLSLGVADGVIALGEFCGEKGPIRDDRVHVVTTDGRPLVTLQGSGIEVGGVSRGFVTATSYGEGAPAGTYVYDLAASRLVRISTDVGEPGPNTVAGGRTLTWTDKVSPGEVKIFAGRWKGSRLPAARRPPRPAQPVQVGLVPVRRPLGPGLVEALVRQAPRCLLVRLAGSAATAWPSRCRSAVTSRPTSVTMPVTK